MSREIKFRAWHNEDKRMVESARGVYTALKDVLNVSTGSGFSNCDTSAKPGRYTFMQYTGIKDRNGKEIYEGDVVGKTNMLDTESEEYMEWINNSDYSEGVDEALREKIPRKTTTIDVVTMGRFPIYWLKNETFGYEGECLEDPEGFEVLGNIYQNPELLEKNQ